MDLMHYPNYIKSKWIQILTKTSIFGAKKVLEKTINGIQTKNSIYKSSVLTVVGIIHTICRLFPFHYCCSGNFSIFNA